MQPHFSFVPGLSINDMPHPTQGEMGSFNVMPLPTFSPAIPINPLRELEHFDPYQSQKFKELPNSKARGYIPDAQGFISLSSTDPFDIQQICTLIEERLAQPQKNWVENFSNGSILQLGESKGSKNQKLKTPPFIPFHMAVEFLVSLIVQKTQVSCTTAAQVLTGEVKAFENGEQRAEIYSYYLKILQGLVSLDVSPSLILLRHSQFAQQNLFYVTLHAMYDSLTWLSTHVDSLKKMWDPEDTDVAMDGESSNTHLNALSGLFSGTLILDRIVREEISAFTRNYAKVQSVAKQMQKKIQFPFEWFPILLQRNVCNVYAKMMIQMIQLVVEVPLPREDFDNGMIWDCFCALATFIFHLLASDEYTGFLLESPECHELFNGLAIILQQLKAEQSNRVHSVRYHILRIFTVLCEKDDPYFLDRLHKMSCSMDIASAVVAEASKIVIRVQDAVSGVNAAADYFRTTREAYRLMELFSYDSNYVTFVIENATFFVLQLLSVPPPIFVKYFQAKGSFQEYIAILTFRLVANLHCYNPDVSPEGQKGKFVHTIMQHFSSLYVLAEDGTVQKQKQLTPPLITANLFYLFQFVTYRYISTVQEHNFWQEFLSLLEENLGIKFPVVKIPGMRLPPPKPKEQSIQTLTPTRPPNAAMVPLAKTPTESPSSKTKILRGFNASFGTVAHGEKLKEIVKTNGGAVLEYVSKTVTHVVCAEDSASIQTSNAKISAAKAKQVPVVSERYIFDCIEQGKILSENPYLLTNHPYKRRLKPT